MMMNVDYSIYLRPKLGERVSGDAAVVKEVEGGLLLGIVDVLGHGPEAHAVADQVENRMSECESTDVIEVLNHLHEGLKGTRGAGAGVAFLEFASGLLHYAGIGNTVLRRVGRQEVSLFSTDGILGQSMRRPKEQSLDLKPLDVILMYTDGVRSHFSLEDYPHINSDTARAIARTVVYRFGKDHDDACCLALRYRP
jgi:serine phosphatase RsbU (regulator of sigma subunit)